MNFVSRAQWGARPPRSTPASINSTVTTGHWEGPNLWGAQIGPHDSCPTKVRGIQAYHMDNNGWSDIAYNAVACPHGYVFEGRGPNRRSAANGTNSANDQSAAVCYLGGVSDSFPAEGQQAMLDAAGWLGDPMAKGHRDWYPTTCPGNVIYDWIQQGHPSPGPGPGPTPPTPTPESEDDLPLHLVIAKGQNEWWLTDWITKRYIQTADQAAQIIVSTRGTGGKIECTPQNGPVVYDAATVNAVPRSDE